LRCCVRSEWVEKGGRWVSDGCAGIRPAGEAPCRARSGAAQAGFRQGAQWWFRAAGANKWAQGRD
jgi:hypothetical protein